MEKTLLLDFDGTVYLKNDMEQTKRNIEMLKALKQAGATSVFVTARPLYAMEQYFKSLEIPYDYVICSNGGLIADDKGKMIYDKPLNDRLTCELSKFLQLYDINVQYQSSDQFADNRWIMNTYLIWIMMKSIGEIRLLEKDLGNHFDNLQIAIDDSFNSMFCSPKKVSKVNAINNLISLGLITGESSLAFGDSSNDIGMIDEFGGALIGSGVESFRGNKVETLEQALKLYY